MTIPANNWCSQCEDACHDHPSVCTVCGAPLGAPPLAAAAAASSNRNNAAGAAGRGGLEGATAALLQETRQANAQLRALMEGIRQQIRATGLVQRELLQDLQQTRAQIEGFRANNNINNDAANNAAGVLQEAEWETMPAELMDPGAASSSSSRSTSQAALKELPRIVLTWNSSILHKATLCLSPSATETTSSSSLVSPAKESLDAVTADFGVDMRAELRSCRLIVAARPSRTGVGGTLDEVALQAIADARQAGLAAVLYLERGGGVTFAQKAILAARAGAAACVIGNDRAEPWPYLMKDSKLEANSYQASSKEKLIPTVMIKQADAQKLLRHVAAACSTSEATTTATPTACASCDLQVLRLQADERRCIICTDTLDSQQKVVQMPGCGHVFHETCALKWLSKHNTCPYCRREMPTDDVAYEAERRRQQRTHAGSAAAARNDYQTFYG